jgi:Uma2 family endonuclease
MGMNDSGKQSSIEELAPFSRTANGMPLLFEDEGLEMGESEVHLRTSDIAFYGLEFHLAPRPQYRVFSDLNLYYDPDEPSVYVSPDVMVVEVHKPLSGDVRSYRIGQDGPAPFLATEVLSFRTFQQGDLTYKPELYARLGISEYLLVDVTGRYLPQKLLLKRRQVDGSWLDQRDADGGITSTLGFRFIIDDDGQLRVLDLATAYRYARPDEAEAIRRKAEEQLRTAQEEIRLLREQLKQKKGQ